MKYLVWFSGWIDSVFVSWYLKDKWHEVLPVNLKNTKEKNKCCALPTELLEITNFLWLPLKVIDATEDFKKFVIDNFIKSYLKWKTPNPCINCNENVRFQILDRVRQELGYDKITTGHYVKNYILEDKFWNKFYTFAIPKDKKKDQTYMIYRLAKYQNIAKNLDFIMWDFLKEEVKKEIKLHNIPINTEKESQNICFIPDDDYPRFIKQAKTIQISWWKILDTKWNYLWEHKWLIYYTIWQRKWLNLSTNEKKYVVDIDWENNILVVWDNEDLLKTEVKVNEAKILFLENIDYSKDILEQLKDIYNIDNVYWKIRYKWNLVKIKEILNNKVKFESPVRAVTSWQHLVLYWEKKGEIFVIGGWEIE